MKNTISCFWAALSLLFVLAGCNKPEPAQPVTPDPEVPAQDLTEKVANRAVNLFAKNFFNTYYLWTAECASKLNSWKDDGSPFDGYAKYKYAADKWGFVTDDYASMNQAFEGVATTPGMAGFFTSYKDTLAYCAKIVYPKSPAEKTGIKRGDVFTGFDGKAVLCPGGKLTPEIEAQMNDIYDRMYSKKITLRYADSKRTVSITPIEMYEDPIVCHKVFDFGGKKVGYLFYDAFVFESVNPLLQVFRQFESEGVSELILDLRYNGGGDVLVADVIASVLAPKAEVEAKSVFTTMVFNSELTKYYKSSDPGSLVSRFSTEFSAKVDGRTVLYDISDINLDIKKLYVIYTSSSASASEALVVGLGPYLDIELFGQKSYGKYCSCLFLSGEGWYNAYKDAVSDAQYEKGMKYAKNWGCYVTVARFADKDGNTGNYPDGFTIPDDNQVEDAWYYPEQFGDPKEQMLAKVLANAGYAAPATKAAGPRNSLLGEDSEVFLDTRVASKPVWGLSTLQPSFVEGLK